MDTAKLILDFIKVLSWPLVALVFLYHFKPHFEDVFARLKSAKFPGGLSIDLSEEIVTAKELSTKLPKSKPPEGKKGVPPNKFNARMISLGLDPSPSGLSTDRYRELAANDPNLAVAGIRIEMEIVGRNLAKGFNIDAKGSRSTSSLFRRLYDAGALSDEQYHLANQILKVGNAAVHGIKISEEDAIALIEVAEVLARQYVDWLSWGFDAK